MMRAIGDGTRKGMLVSGYLVDTGKICEIHNTPIYLRTRPRGTESEFCWDCQQKAIDNKKNAVDIAYQNQAILAGGYAVFKRESILSAEIAKANFQNFKVENETDEKALNYAERLVRDYSKDMVGNAVIKGNAGVGKSHLSMSIAKQLNETFKSYNEKKSVLFISVSRLVQLVQDSFNQKDSKYTQERMTKLLTECDYLVLDDLGKESTTGNNVKPASDWTYRFLFNILDSRETTIINTNFSVKELQRIYDKPFTDRILKGAKNNIFSYPENAESKRY